MIQGGDLSDFIKKNHRHIEEKTSAGIMRQVFETVNYLHNSNIAHRDLKPENMMIEDKDELSIKLIDFGTAVKFTPNSFMSSKIGTVRYFASFLLAFLYSTGGSQQII